MSDSTWQTPKFEEFAYLRLQARKEATIIELAQTLETTRIRFKEFEKYHPYSDGYARVAELIFDELSKRGEAGRAELIRILESRNYDFALALIRLTVQLAQEETVAYLRSSVETSNDWSLNAEFHLKFIERYGKIQPEFEKGRPQLLDDLPMLSNFREGASDPTEDRRLTFEFYGLTDGNLPLIERWDEITSTFGLKRFQDQLKKLLLPSFGICLLHPKAPCPIGASRFGGTPDTPVGFSWPQNQAGEYLSFIGQIRLSEVKNTPVATYLPQTGMLYFFYAAQEQPWSEDESPGSWQVRFHPDETDLGRLVEAIPETIAFPSKLAIMNFEWTLDVTNDAGWDNLNKEGVTAGEWELVDLFARELPRLQATGHHEKVCQLLGHPQLIQSDVSELSFFEDNADLLLLQVGSDGEEGGMMWGDGGNIYYWIHADDLAQGDFSRVRGHLECY